MAHAALATTYGARSISPSGQYHSSYSDANDRDAARFYPHGTDEANQNLY